MRQRDARVAEIGQYFALTGEEAARYRAAHGVAVAEGVKAGAACIIWVTK
jgi:hypothetical protein